MKTLLLLLCGLWGNGSTDQITIDMIELNHVVDSQDSKIKYSQYILWQEQVLKDRFRLRAISWFMVNNSMPENYILTKRGGVYNLSYYNEEMKKRITISAPVFKESSTNCDNERENRFLNWGDRQPTVKELFEEQHE